MAYLNAIKVNLHWQNLVTKVSRGHIFSCVRPIYEWAVSDRDPSRGCIFSCVRPIYEQAVSELDP